MPSIRPCANNCIGVNTSPCHCPNGGSAAISPTFCDPNVPFCQLRSKCFLIILFNYNSALVANDLLLASSLLARVLSLINSNGTVVNVVNVAAATAATTVTTSQTTTTTPVKTTTITTTTQPPTTTTTTMTTTTTTIGINVLESRMICIHDIYILWNYKVRQNNAHIVRNFLIGLCKFNANICDM